MGENNDAEKILKEFESKLIAVIDGFQKEHGLFVERIEYDGYDHSATYTFCHSEIAKSVFERKVRNLLN